jgi:hypothetical protein
LATDLAILDVILIVAATGIEPDFIFLAAIRTAYDAAHISGAVAEWEVTVEVEIVRVFFESETHTS